MTKHDTHQSIRPVSAGRILWDECLMENLMPVKCEHGILSGKKCTSCEEFHRQVHIKKCEEEPLLDQIVLTRFIDDYGNVKYENEGANGKTPEEHFDQKRAYRGPRTKVGLYKLIKST